VYTYGKTAITTKESFFKTSVMAMDNSLQTMLWSIRAGGITARRLLI
jgi:hypothetical protein